MGAFIGGVNESGTNGSKGGSGCARRILVLAPETKNIPPGDACPASRARARSPRCAAN